MTRLSQYNTSVIQSLLETRSRRTVHHLYADLISPCRIRLQFCTSNFVLNILDSRVEIIVADVHINARLLQHSLGSSHHISSNTTKRPKSSLSCSSNFTSEVRHHFDVTDSFTTSFCYFVCSSHSSLCQLVSLLGSITDDLFSLVRLTLTSHDSLHDCASTFTFIELSSVSSFMHSLDDFTFWILQITDVISEEIHLAASRMELSSSVTARL